MVKAIKFYDFGGPEVLKIEETEIGSPGDDDVLIPVSYTHLTLPTKA